MSALELIGPLAALVAFAGLCKRKPVKIWVDNAGSVRIWSKGYSSYCGLCTTLVKAISVVAAGLGSRVEIVKITRCLSSGAVIADKLSKLLARLEAGRKSGRPMAAEPAQLPEPLLKWVCLPVPDDNLGHVLLQHLAGSGIPILGYSFK